MDITTITRENLHGIMQQLSQSHRKSTYEEKYRAIEQISQLMKTLDGDEIISADIRRILDVKIETGDYFDDGQHVFADRREYIVFTFDSAAGEHYVYCALCACFSTSKSKMTTGIILENYSKANSLVKFHEKSAQHKKVCQFLNEKKTAVQSTRPVNATCNQLPPSIPAVAVGAKQDHNGNIHNVFEKQPVERNRQIVHDVISCVLLLVTLGWYFFSFFR